MSWSGTQKLDRGESLSPFLQGELLAEIQGAANHRDAEWRALPNLWGQCKATSKYPCTYLEEQNWVWACMSLGPHAGTQALTKAYIRRKENPMKDYITIFLWEKKKKTRKFMIGILVTLLFAKLFKYDFLSSLSLLVQKHICWACLYVLTCKTCEIQTYL